MCRLFGLIADHPTDISYWMTGCQHPFQSWANVHCHGYGIGWYEEGRACVKKEPISALVSQQFSQVVNAARSHLFVAHLRKATVGDHTVENCHPFEHNSWLFAHNGTVDRDALIKLLDSHYRSQLSGATDSEVLFYWLLQEIYRDPEVAHHSWWVSPTALIEDRLKSAITEVKKHSYTSLKFILTDGTTLYAYRDAPDKLDYYTLYYLPIITPDQRTVIVCSERLTDDNWLEIPVGHLLTVSATITPALSVAKL